MVVFKRSMRRLNVIASSSNTSGVWSGSGSGMRVCIRSTDSFVRLNVGAIERITVFISVIFLVICRETNNDTNMAASEATTIAGRMPFALVKGIESK